MTAAIKATLGSRHGLLAAIREPPCLHGAVQAAAPGNRAALLFPADEARDRYTTDADGGNHPPTPGRQDYGRAECHQSLNPAL